MSWMFFSAVSPLYIAFFLLLILVLIILFIYFNKTTKAVRRSEKSFKLLAENASDTIFHYRLRPSPGFEYISPAITALTGYTPEEFYLDPYLIFRIIHPDDKDAFKGLMNSPDFHTSAVVHRWRKKDKTIVYAESQFTGTRNKEGDVETVEGIIKDMTDRMHQDEAVRKTVSEWQSTFDAIGDAVCLLDKKGKVFGYNKAAGTFFNRPAAKIIGHECCEFIHGNMKQDLECPFRRMIQTRSRESNVYPVDERWFRISVDPLMAEDGTLMGAVHITSDITEQKNADNALRDSEERYRSLVELLPDAIVVHSGGRILFTNSAASRMLGGPLQKKLEGKLIYDFIHPDFCEKIEEQSNAILKSKTLAPPIEGKFKKLDESTFDAEIVASPYVFQNEPAVLAVIRDLSERKRLETKLRQSQKMEAVGRLAGGVAHDFNNLLTTIIGYSDLMLMDKDIKGNTHEIIKTIMETGERAAQLTRQLLAFSRKDIFEPVNINLNEVIEGMSKMFPRLLGEDIECRFSLDPMLKKIKADPSQIEQVILNLVVNSREAMPKGGVLSISTGNIFLDDDYVNVHPDAIQGQHVELSVLDTGTGISLEIMEHIFEPFFTTKKEGTGLGLATVYGVVKNLSGHISCSSEEGSGTTFKIFIPALDKEILVKEKSQESISMELPQGEETVLVVEDERSLRELTDRLLSGLGYRVLTASSGEEALSLVHVYEGAINLLLTDVVLPGDRGTEVAEKLKVIYPGIKILFMSGYAGERIESNKEDEIFGKSNFLPKPFNPGMLARKVRAVLDNQ